jgi:putative pectin methylesterase
VEPYDLEDTDSTCKRLVRKGFVRMSDIKFPLPYRPDSFNLVIVSDALDYLTPRYLNKTLPGLARVSTDGLVIFAGMCFFLKYLPPSLFMGNPHCTYTYQ